MTGSPDFKCTTPGKPLKQVSRKAKGVFQMHHFKVRSPQAILLQDHFATFAANFVRWASLWLALQQKTLAPKVQTGVKQAVRVLAHTSAWVIRQGDDFC
jgi:hypothetical protein